VLLGGRDDAGASAPADDDMGDWGRTPSQPARGAGGGGGGAGPPRRQQKSDDFDDLDDEIPF
jgi:hypothetical protein